MKGKIDFHQYLIDNPDEYEGNCYAVFEEPYDEKGKLKTYDLLRGVFDDLQIAKEYSATFPESHVAIYSEYIEGNYNYL